MSQNILEKEINFDKVNEILDSYKDKKWSLIPVLQEIQEEFGYIPKSTIPIIAEALNVFPSEVQGVISFYSQFYTTPRGKNIVKVCRGTACHVKGGKSILKIVKQLLNVEDGETTPDFKFTLETVACLGACFLAPTMLVNKEYYGKLVPQRVANILKQYGWEKNNNIVKAQ